MKKATFKNFATIAALALVFAIAFGITFGVCDAHVFAPAEVGYASSAETSATSDYYASIEAIDASVKGSSFRTQLARLIGPSSNGGTHKSQPTYKGLINVFPDTDANPSNKSQMLWYYTGTVAKSGTNREHVWPKNGGKAFPAESETGSDAHHLRPTDQQLNSSRSSLSFGEVPQVAGNIVKEYGSTTYSNLCYKTSQYFYPGVGYRGSTARILMYVQTRWGDAYNLQFVLGDGNNKTIGDIETLMKWHLEEPVTEAEKLRNDEVQKIQGNRNPFIDHPEYAERIYCYDGKSYNSKLQAVVAAHAGTEPITKISFKETSVSLGVGETTTLTPTYAPTNAKREVTWTSSDSTVASVDANGKVTAKANGTATITVASKENSSIKASVTVTVKSVTSISVSGAPTKTTYNDGEAFSSAGITVTAHFSDGTTKIVPNTSCQWLDGTTRANTLSAGSASVICKYGTHEAIINGITVNKVVAGTKTTINLDSTSSSGSYAWYGWEANGMQGKVYMYKNTQKNAIQMNNKTNVCCYLYNTTAAPNNILSITIKLKEGSDKTFEVRTSNTPFTEGTSQPTTGKSVGTITASTNATTLKINSTDKYFAICYTGTGACYIESIEILYGEETPVCDHTYGEWTITKAATTESTGLKSHSCTKCGHTETQVIPKVTCEHTYGNWTVTKEATYQEEGSQSRTCTKCNHTETQTIPKLVCTDHTYGDWQVTKDPTYKEEGSKTHSCTKCGHTETESIEKLVCTDHSYGDWTVTKEATETESGIKTRTCENCGHKDEQVIPKTGCDHEFGGWYITKEPTGTEAGEKTRKCLLCGHAETAVVPATGEVSDVTAKDFIDAVNAIKNATTEEEKADAIAYAESVFGSLTSQDKTSSEVTEAFNTLYEIKNPPTIIVVKEQLSGGAIAGIVIGCVASVSIVAVIAILATRKKRLAK